MNATNNMLATVSAQSHNRADAIAKILHASRNASSLSELRAEIDRIAEFSKHVDALHEEKYRAAETV